MSAPHGWDITLVKPQEPFLPLQCFGKGLFDALWCGFLYSFPLSDSWRTGMPAVLGLTLFC